MITIFNVGLSDLHHNLDNKTLKKSRLKSEKSHSFETTLIIYKTVLDYWLK